MTTSAAPRTPLLTACGLACNRGTHGLCDHTRAIRCKLAGPITRETLGSKIRPLLKALDG